MKKKIYAALAFALYATTFHAQQIYELSAPVKEKTIYTGHLKICLLYTSPSPRD